MTRSCPAQRGSPSISLSAMSSSTLTPPPRQSESHGALNSQGATLCLVRFFEPRFIVRIQRCIRNQVKKPAPDGAARIQVVVTVPATLKTLREAVWFEMNPRPCHIKWGSIFSRGQGFSSKNSGTLRSLQEVNDALH